MSSLVGYVYVASNNGDTFSNAYNNDFLFVTQSNTQNILLGCSNGANAFLTISSSNATFNGSLAFNNSLTIAGLQINPSSGVSANMTQTSVSGLSNDNYGMNLYIASNTSNNYFKFFANNAELYRINGLGYVGVLNSNPKYPLDVGGNIHGTSNIYLGSNVGVGYSNYPVDLSGVTGNIVTSGNICAGNLGMFRNRIINGDMRINQRGIITSALTTYVAIYTVDRFVIHPWGGNTTFSNVSLVNTDAPYKYGFRNSFKNTLTAQFSGENWYSQRQYIEGYNIQDFNWGQTYGSPVTVSFWSKTSGITNFPVTLQNSAQTYSYNYNVAVTSSGVWQYNTVTIPQPPATSLGTWDISGSLSSVGMIVHIGSCVPIGMASSSGWASGNYIGVTGVSTNWITTIGNYIEFTGLQLEKGTIATPFEFRPFTVELQLCQRYFCTSYDYGFSPGSVSMNGRIGTYSPDTSTMWMMTFPVAMRATATMIAYAGNTGTAGCFNLGGNVTNYSIKYGGSSTRSALFYSENAGAAGNYYYVHYSANAEL